MYKHTSGIPQLSRMCVCVCGFVMRMKGRALVNIDENCHSVLLAEAHLEMRGMTFTHTHTHTYVYAPPPTYTHTGSNRQK